MKSLQKLLLASFIQDRNIGISPIHLQDDVNLIDVVDNNEGDVDLIDVIDNNEDVNSAIIDDGVSLLHHAASQGDAASVRQLIGQHVNVNAIDSNGCTPLFYAVYMGFSDIVKLLIDYKAYVNIYIVGMSVFFTPLHAATTKGVIELLIAGGAIVNARDELGNTALHFHAYSGNEQAILTLIDNGADPWIKGKDSKTPVDYYQRYTERTLGGQSCRSGYLTKLKEAYDKATTFNNTAALLTTTLAVGFFASGKVSFELPNLAKAAATILIVSHISYNIAYRMFKPSTEVVEVAPECYVVEQMNNL